MIRLVETLEGLAIGSMMRPTRPMDDSFRLRSVGVIPRHRNTSRQHGLINARRCGRYIRTMGILIAVQSVTLGNSLSPGQVKTSARFCLPLRLQVSVQSIRRRIAPGGRHRDGTNRRRERYPKNPGDRHESRIARAYPLPSTPPLVVHVRNFKTRFQVTPNTL